MARSRVMSFMSSFGPSRNTSQSTNRKRASSASFSLESPKLETPSPDAPSPVLDASPIGALSRAERRTSRPGSTIFSSKPPELDVAEDTPAELHPVFTFLNSQANKLYHEGYFLRLNDLDTHGEPCVDRQWVECYAQLVGTVLSLWNAAALDAAQEGQEVPPTFINLADASMKMIETLPTKSEHSQPLKNVLSLCSAGQNRYLLHFNSFNSLVQWAAAIRLSMFEHASLYEAYTGSILAGKGKGLNNINSILERTRFKHEDWARVRFGAGTPWRRCWFVVSPPDEKEVQKARKTTKRQSAYDRSPPLIRGNIKFYESKKTKKGTPIATITNAYSAYAIYPHSIPLIEQSTLVKIEGQITMHSPFPSSTEGLVFVMPETHAAVSGFEMMLRFLVPTFDTFHLYGRPNRLIAATNHIKSIMFAFPRHRRHGYLETLDIVNLMQAPGCQIWSEAEWKQQLKEATMRRMSAGDSAASSISSSKPRYRASLPNRQSNMPTRLLSPTSDIQTVDSVIPENSKHDPVSPSSQSQISSETAGLPTPFQPPKSHSNDSPVSSVYRPTEDSRDNPKSRNLDGRSSSENAWRQNEQAAAVREGLVSPSPPAPVVSPPAFTHGPGEVPSVRPRPSLDARNANNRMSNATFIQLAAAGNMSAAGAGEASPGPAAKRSAGNLSQQNVSANSNPYSSETRGLGVSDVNWRASSEVIASPIPVASPINKNRFSLDTGKSLKRKPVPNLGITSPGTEPSLDDLRHTLDEDVLNQVGSRVSPHATPMKQQDEESVYDDVSPHSPDYASTHGSVYSKGSVKSVQQPRRGVMKTVGGPAPQRGVVIGDAHYPVEQPLQSNPDIPNVDFGPTMTYLPANESAETLKRPGHQRIDSNATERQPLHVPTHPLDASHSRTATREEARRSIPGQPAMSNARPNSPGSAPPPPPPHIHGQPRPRSRDTAKMMTPNDISHLSAREQEHIARTTGSSFFNLSTSSNRQQPQNPRGLVGAIDARQREKQGIKEGMSNHMVQHAIAQRQQHQQYQDPRASLPPNYAPPTNGYNPYNLPAAGHTVDSLNQPLHPDDPRRQAWSVPAQSPPVYQQNQFYGPPPGQ